MKKWIKVCLFIVNDHGISGKSTYCLCLLVVPSWIPIYVGLGIGDYRECGECSNTLCWCSSPPVMRSSLPRDPQCKWWHKGAWDNTMAKKDQARTRREIVP